MEENQQLNMKVLLSVGMKVMVTENIATSVNFTNGSCAVIVDVILDDRKGSKVPTMTSEGIHLLPLHYPPRFIILHLDFSKLRPLPFLKEKEVPLFPIARKF